MPSQLLAAALALASGCTPASRRMDRVLDVAVQPLESTFRLVYAPVDEDVAEAVRDAARVGLAAAGRWGKLDAPFTVWVYPDHDALIDAVGSQDYPWLRAWARYDEILLQSPRTWGIDYTEQLPELLRHELTHVVMYQRVASASTWEKREIPLWFREGMASWTAGQGYRRGRPDKIGTFLRGHRDVDPFQPDSDLLHEHKDLVYNTGHWAFDHLVRKGGEEQVKELMDLMRSDVPFQAAFERVFGLSESAFRRRWRSLVTGEPTPGDLRPGPAPGALQPPGTSGDVACPGSVRLHPATVAPGGRVQVEVEVERSGVARPEPAAGALDGVEVLSQRASTTIRAVGGEVIARHVLTLVMRAPDRPGAVTIGPFLVRTDEGVCRLAAATLEVGGAPRGEAPPPAAPPRRARPRRRSRQGIELRAPDGPIPPGDEARVDFVFPRTVHRVQLSRPDVPGVWLTEALGDDRLRWTLEPIFYGDVSAGPLLAMAATGGGLFSAPRRVSMKSPPLALTFSPPPAPPAGLDELLATTAGTGDAGDRTVVLALDLSSSLRTVDVGGRSRLHWVGGAVVKLAGALPSTTRVGLVLYREGAFTYVAPGQAPGQLVDALGRLRWDDLPEEGTGTGVAVLQAVRHLQPLAGRRHVLLLSDGDCGPVRVSCSTAGRIARAFGIPVSALVVGGAGDAAPVEALVRATRGKLVRVSAPGQVAPAVAALVEAATGPGPRPDLAALRPSNLPLAWRRLDEMDRRLRLEYFARGRPGETL